MFETYVYQPFFNILVGLYEVLGRISPDLADMGIAVIIFSLIIQLILFPLRLAGERSEEEKKKIVERVEEAKRLYSHEPIKQREAIKTIMHANLRSVMASTANLLIGLGIIIMLYRIFTTGLEGADFYLLYDFVPQPGHINLMFLGKYDLSHTNATLNLVQSIMIFVVEVLAALRSPFPISRKDKALLQIFLPIGSFIIFMFLPSGKKIFMITTLVFSAVYQSIKLLQEWGQKLIDRVTPKPPVEATPLPTPDIPETPVAHH
ncbi:YidC/Oxa1 family membrane protein insertase [Candidatus Woesebacteria bacterium]|nr:YidC/Oxa1 family membrane protein insertase [Candidatus Woesebacteria bacterium]